MTFCSCRCKICNSVGSGKWLMVHPPVILRQAGEYVHFAWFPSSIFQTSPELGVTQLETGFRRSSNTNGRAGPDDTITLFSMNTSANMLCVGGELGVLRGRRQGFCVRWDGVNRQIGSLLRVSSLRFHAGWIYRESQCIGMRLRLHWGQYQRECRAVNFRW